MTISSQVRTAGPFLGNGTATGGTFSFKVFSVTDLAGIETSNLGVDRALVYGTDFNVTLNPDQNASPGGTINYLIAGVGPSLIPTGYNLNFTSAVANLQPVALTNAGGFFPKVINDALDRLTILVQQLVRGVNASLKFPLSDSTALNTTIPNAILRANKGLKFDGSGNVILTTGDPDASAAAAAAAAASAAAAAASQVQTAAAVVTTGNNATAAAASAAAAAASAAGMKYRAVRGSTTANDTLSGLAARDGVTPVAGERWLVKNQSAPADNGIYVAAAGAWSRAADMDTWAEVPGTVVVITEGTTLADTVWLCTANDGGTLGTTAITFVDWSAVIIDGSLTTAKYGTNSVTNAKLAQMATLTLKSNITGGTANAADNTLSAILDVVIASARGTLLFRGASGWAALAPGTAGFVLQTNGAGADPSWVDPIPAALGVKSLIFAQYSGSLPLAAGTVVAAATLTDVTLGLIGASTGPQPSGDSLTGTWRCMVTYTTSNTYVGLFQRVT